MESDPNFAQHEQIGEILNTANDSNVLLSQVHGIQEHILGSIDGTWKRINDIAQDVRFTRERWAIEERQLKDARLARVKTIEMEGYRSAANLAATFIGMHDPKLGRQIEATTSAYFGLRQAIDAYESAIADGASSALAGLMLTGNAVGVGLALVGTFMDTGPTADELILQEIGRLREQVENMRREMHSRFDEVHAHIDAVYGNTPPQFRRSIGK